MVGKPASPTDCDRQHLPGMPGYFADLLRDQPGVSTVLDRRGRNAPVPTGANPGANYRIMVGFIRADTGYLHFYSFKLVTPVG
jgi:hypothetical protein